MFSSDDFLDSRSDASADSADPAASRVFQTWLLEETLRVVRRRRRLRQARGVMLLVGCFLAGMTTMYFFVPKAPRMVADPLPNVAQQAPHLRPQGEQQTAPSQARTAYELQRAAGDLALHDPRRLTSAVYRYSRAVALASPTQRAIDPERDSWLLMALKLDERTSHPSQELEHDSR